MKRVFLWIGAAGGILLSATGALRCQSHLPPRTGSVLVGDRLGDAIWILTDFNLDGDSLDPGETTTWYSGTPPLALDTIQDIAIGTDGRVFVSDSGLAGILVLVDGNADGDANDPGESSVFFDASNAEGIMFGALQGITVAPSPLGDVIWAAVLGTATSPEDMVLRLCDLDGDGDANDAGEAIVFYSRAASTAAGGPDLQSPTAVEIDATGAVLLLHGIGSSGAPPGLYRIADTNGDGDGDDAGEVTAWFQLPTVGIPIATDVAPSRSGGFYVTDRGSADTVYAVRDLDGDGQTSGPVEVTAYWTAAGPSLVDNLCEIVQSDGSLNLLMAEEQSPNRVLRLHDDDTDGHIAAPTEVSIRYDETAPGVPIIAQPKVVEALPSGWLAGPATVVPGHFLHLTHTSAPGRLVSIGWSPLAISQLVPPVGLLHLALPVTPLVINAAVPTNGVFDFITDTPDLPALNGTTSYFQSLDVDGVNGTLSNLFVLTFQ